MISKRSILAVLAFIALGPVGVAEPVFQPHVKLEVVASESALQPGRPAEIGIRFDLEPGWHLYWKNPGDSGRAPRIQFELPSGFEAGELRWPTPRRIPFGRLVNYGYERKLLLAAPVTVPEVYDAPTVPVLARVDWLVCAEECIPGKLDMRATFPIAPDTPEPSPSAELFRATEAALPKTPPVEWTLEGFIEGDDLFIRMSGFSVLGETLFFPAEPRVIENAAPQTMSRQGNALELRLRRSEHSSDALSRLNGVLMIGGVGYGIDVGLARRTKPLLPWVLAGLGVILAIVILFWTSTRRRERRRRPPEKKALRYYFPVWQQ